MTAQSQCQLHSCYQVQETALFKRVISSTLKLHRATKLIYWQRCTLVSGTGPFIVAVHSLLEGIFVQGLGIRGLNRRRSKISTSTSGKSFIILNHGAKQSSSFLLVLLSCGYYRGDFLSFFKVTF